MTDVPFKLRTLRALTDAMKEITVANGYHFDMADFDPGDGATTSHVFRGRAWFGDGDALPMLSILEGMNPVGEVGEAPSTSHGAAYDWDILLQGFVEDDPDNPTDPAYLLLADVRKRLSVERCKLASTLRAGQNGPFEMGHGPNRIESLTFGSGVVRPADDVSAKAWFWLPITLRIVEDAADPYI